MEAHSRLCRVLGKRRAPSGGKGEGEGVSEGDRAVFSLGLATRVERTVCSLARRRSRQISGRGTRKERGSEEKEGKEWRRMSGEGERAGRRKE